VDIDSLCLDAGRELSPGDESLPGNDNAAESSPGSVFAADKNLLDSPNRLLLRISL